MPTGIPEPEEPKLTDFENAIELLSSLPGPTSVSQILSRAGEQNIPPGILNEAKLCMGFETVRPGGLSTGCVWVCEDPTFVI